MDHLRNLTNTTLSPSVEDLLLAVPRFAQRAGSFALFYLPEQFDSLLAKALNGGSIIAQPTTSDSINTTIITGFGNFAQGTVPSATADPTTGGLTMDPASWLTLQNIRSIGGVFSYLFSKWALATLTMAIILNRTQFYASSRIPLNLRWYLRLAIYIVPITSFVYHILWNLQALRCQTSPDWIETQYSDGKNLKIDFAGEGGFLYMISSSLLFWEDETSSCAAVNMLPGTDGMLRKSGSLKLLWPMFLSLGTSAFVETLACSLQGRTPVPETGMTIFEHSLAFAEAENTITRPFYLSAAKIAQKSDPKSSNAALELTKTAFLQAVNVPTEVLVISLISSLNHLCSNLLAVAGLRTKLRLVNTSIWGVAYMIVFLWAFVRAIASATSDSPFDGGLLRFPTVCIIGFIPHLLICAGICGCAIIYGLALLLTAAALSLPEGAPVGFWSRLTYRFSAAHRNLQANVHLGATPAIRINWQEDFYTALLKIGFSILTAASEAVYLNEGTRIAVNSSTWLEEKRIQQFITDRKGLKRTMDCVPLELLEDQIADGIVSTDPSGNALGAGQISGYARERKSKTQQSESDTATLLRRDPGVGFAQRRSRWYLAAQLMKGLAWTTIGLSAHVLLSTFRTIGIPFRPRWLTALVGREKTSKGASAQKQRRNEFLKSIPFWMLNEDGELALPTDDHVDVEEVMRNRLASQLQDSSGSPSELGQRLDSDLYSWWKSGGWWGDVDTSGDYQDTVQEDDTTSMISATDASELEWPDVDEEDGRRTPTQRNPFPASREATPFQEDFFEPTHLAALLDPQNSEQREESRLLARHLRSSNIMTRSRHRKAVEQERARLINSSSQYPRLQPLEDEEHALEQFILERRGHTEAFRQNVTGEGTSWASGAEGMGSGGPQCVVCQTVPRTILMWPCGCLSLCDDCRVGLATRNFNSCVCCRTNVVAYSRLFVP